MILTIVNKIFLTNLVFLLAAATVTYKNKTFMEGNKKLFNWWAVLSGLVGFPIALLNIWLF